MGYTFNETIHLIFHFLSYSVVDLESSLKVPFVINLGIYPSPKIVGEIIGSSYILFFFKQPVLVSILASLNLSLLYDALVLFLFFALNKEKSNSISWYKSASIQKNVKFIDVQIKVLVFMVYKFLLNILRAS